ncbi:MAG: ANTAR domain-containing protein, partial [Propionicimonas sp.]|nr:ANTAR domain-containing protein [Propionicimonas sp.]
PGAWGGPMTGPTGERAASAPSVVTNPVMVEADSIDAAWRQAVIRSIRDGLLIFDSEGLVLELNQAFTDLLGYRLEDGPFRPPYPWWPTEQEDPEALAKIQDVYQGILGGDEAERELLLYRRDRRPLWVLSGGTVIHHQAIGMTHLRTLRDVTRAHEATERRAAAAEVSQGFATVDDLAALIGIAEHGFGLLFDGNCTIRLSDGGSALWFSAADAVAADQLPDEVLRGLDGERDPDTTRRRPGILLVAPTPDTDSRAWIQFPQPRRITVEEMIAADLLAVAFAAALGRVTTAQEAADREANLRVAVESHRLIGQATGILVERHRMLPGAAFERLRRASQQRNLKLRDLAAQVIETGADPESA